ncbi:CatB-related O-acetyltransferase [Enterococcus hulanensis]|uniref:CatB-related O-acetyltransferase n=1 Tax=Enterococcus hulanensis TaxID=2559929 RepID=A0ABU3EZG7_9ENTE|nr:CatB-related O-acetyltransferase [Enterococcus hulanensis]MDT2600051.1 CatB-related O-acetyltransferase [Enterococcus hulanensis]MDT2610125.1 CatB-related O-acetyltransferase [Enterococcus hulanensis]MDT2617933.1 CatB-related O-acetyltransferase [Enterococcus hulanensis]MDT2629903.1 CatB-related O-acetyltransferase [Enterococcus hulanensis]MDT2656498.1 CatB-related O-acetyltransferase [Enterococcus hulanensis]
MIRYQIELTEEIKNIFRQKKVFLQRDKKFNRLDGNIKFLSDLKVEPYSQTVSSGGNLYTCGSFSYSLGARLPLTTKIGRYCSIAPCTAFSPGRHDMRRFTTSPVALSNPTEIGIFADGKNMLNSVDFNEVRLPIVIENDVWIGKDVLIKPGVHIGNGAIIGERTIVTRDVEPYSVVVGAPGTAKKLRFTDKEISSLIESEWWKYNYQDFRGINGNDDIEVFLDKFNDLKQNNEIQPYEPICLNASDIYNCGD